MPRDHCKIEQVKQRGHCKTVKKGHCKIEKKEQKGYCQTVKLEQKGHYKLAMMLMRDCMTVKKMLRCHYRIVKLKQFGYC